MEVGLLNDLDLLIRFGVALVVGFLVGLQREFASEEPDREIAVGVRTFALLAAIGFAAALLSDMSKTPTIIAAVIGILGILFSISYYQDASRGSPGLTTKVSAILTVLIGALAFYNRLTLVVAIGVAATALLSFKGEMHRFAHHLTREDLFAALKFAVVSAVILPVLPDKNYGPLPFNVLNPYKIWLFVALISGISFVGYVLIKWKGSKKGIGLTGLLGGLASSTAVSISFANRSRTSPKLAKQLAFAVLLAWTVMFVKVIVEVVVINPKLVTLIWKPFTASAAAGILYCAVLFRTQKTDRTSHHVPFSNPFELGTALKFGAIFAVILMISKGAQTYFGNIGIYSSSFLSSLVDVDAVVLSVAQLNLNPGGLDAKTAAGAITLAAVSNTLFKGAIALTAGAIGLRRTVLPGFLLMIFTCLIMTFIFLS